jgi:hypothetical protein
MSRGNVGAETSAASWLAGILETHPDLGASKL